MTAERRFLLFMSLIATVAAGVMALGPLEGIAHVSDEVAYTLQAKLFAGGMRVGPPGDQPSMLLYPFWETGTASYAIFPPGWPALLALGVAAGAPWLVNALMAGALPPLSWALARAWERPDEEARLAAMVAALSPGIILLAGSRMSHTSVLVALLLALVVVERRRDGPWVWVSAAVAIAYVVVARPYDAVLLGGPLLLLGALRLGPRPLLAVWLGLPALATALVLADNQALTGAPLTFPVGPWYDSWVADYGRPPGCNALGFGEDRGCHPTLGMWGHSPAKAARIAAETGQLLDRFLLGLPGGLLVAAVGLWRTRRFVLVGGALVAIVGGYALYWSPGNVFGARFWHPLYAVLPVLVAAGFCALPGKLRSWLPALVISLGCIFSLGRVSIELIDGYWCVDAQPRAVLEKHEVLGTDAVVLVHVDGSRSEDYPHLGREGLSCDPLLSTGGVFVLGDPTRSTGGLQVRHALGTEAENRAYLERYHPGTPAWFLLGDARGDRWELRRIRAGGAGPGR